MITATSPPNSIFDVAMEEGQSVTGSTTKRSRSSERVRVRTFTAAAVPQTPAPSSKVVPVRRKKSTPGSRFPPLPFAVKKRSPLRNGLDLAVPIDIGRQGPIAELSRQTTIDIDTADLLCSLPSPQVEDDGSISIDGTTALKLSPLIPESIRTIAAEEIELRAQRVKDRAANFAVPTVALKSLDNGTSCASIHHERRPLALAALRTTRDELAKRISLTLGEIRRMTAAGRSSKKRSRSPSTLDLATNTTTTLAPPSPEPVYNSSKSTRKLESSPPHHKLDTPAESKVDIPIRDFEPLLSFDLDKDEDITPLLKVAAEDLKGRLKVLPGYEPAVTSVKRRKKG
ncbi:hypothetical protein HDU93_002725 [Gonapodya sp. JEL0774]|nr:hypothetical protein HDU93_002725 [Gonapodya sp. JEL0774]